MQAKIKEKFIVDQEMHGNSNSMGEECGDPIWVGWTLRIWLGVVKSSTKQHIHVSLCN